MPAGKTETLICRWIKLSPPSLFMFWVAPRVARGNTTCISTTDVPGKLDGIYDGILLYLTLYEILIGTGNTGRCPIRMRLTDTTYFRHTLVADYMCWLSEPARQWLA